MKITEEVEEQQEKLSEQTENSNPSIRRKRITWAKSRMKLQGSEKLKKKWKILNRK